MSVLTGKELLQLVTSFVKETLQKTQFASFTSVPELDTSSERFIVLFHPDDAKLLSSLVQKRQKLALNHIHSARQPFMLRVDERERLVSVKLAGLPHVTLAAADKSLLSTSPAAQRAFKRRLLERLLKSEISTASCCIEPISFWASSGNIDMTDVTLDAYEDGLTVHSLKLIEDSYTYEHLFRRSIDLNRRVSSKSTQTQLFKRAKTRCHFAIIDDKPAEDKRAEIFISMATKVLSELKSKLKPEESAGVISHLRFLLNQPWDTHWDWTHKSGQDIRDSSDSIGFRLSIALSLEQNGTSFLHLEAISQVEKDQPDLDEANSLDVAISNICYEAAGAVSLFGK